MIWYFLLTLLLVVYFEISGQLVLNLLNFDRYDLAFPFGLMSILAFLFLTTGAFTFSNCSFWLVMALCALYVLITIFLFIKNRKNIKWKFSIFAWILLLVIVFIMLFYAYNTTLGETSGFDSTYYLNFISTNIGKKSLNTTDFFYGGYTSGQSAQYTFQSYYYFASCIVFLFVRILSHITIVNNYSAIIWVFQILFNFFLGSIIINSIKLLSKNKKLLSVTFAFIFVFFYGKLYWNNVYGFYGNSFRTIAMAYSIMIAYELFNKDTQKNWILFSICLLATCAFSSSGVFSIIFLLFGMYFVLVDSSDHMFKYYALILFVPLMDLICVVLSLKILYSFIISLIISVLLFYLNNYLVKLSRLKFTKKIIFSFFFILTIALSLMVTKNPFDFRAFTNNHSEVADMTINYFHNYGFLAKSEKIYRMLIWLLLGYVSIFENKNKLIKAFIIIFVIFFSPFNCPIIYKFNIVYHRALDIIINPFTVLLYLSMFYNKINHKYVYSGTMTILLILFITGTDFINPNYYHESFIPGDNYNNIMKMSNDEFDVLNRLREEVKYVDKMSYIVSTNLFTESIIPDARFIYGRLLLINPKWSNAEKQVYSIFYPPAYLGDVCKEIEADYDNVGLYLSEANIDFLIVDKSKEYYNKNENNWQYLIYKVAECGYGYSIYSNDNYELFKFGD